MRHASVSCRLSIDAGGPKRLDSYLSCMNGVKESAIEIVDAVILLALVFWSGNKHS